MNSRAIANLILDEGDRIERPITNLALRKLLYFAHGLFLIERKRPLVSGYFEAWNSAQCILRHIKRLSRLAIEQLPSGHVDRTYSLANCRPFLRP